MSRNGGFLRMRSFGGMLPLQTGVPDELIASGGAPEAGCIAMTQKKLILRAVLGVAAFGVVLWLISWLLSDKPPEPGPGEEDRSVIEVSGTKNQNRIADVVFVHGLGGDGRGTWQADNGPFWPEWIGEDVEGVGVWSVHYEASPAKWIGHTMPIPDRATNLLNRLATRTIGTERPVVFVAHSLGGLVVKEMLHQAATLGDPQWEGIVRNTKGVAFLATPHSGAGMADFVEALFKVLTTESVQDLKASAAPLRQLNIWYRNYAPKQKIATLVLYEKYKLYNVLVVDEARADPGISGVIPIPADANHLSICKPTSRNSDIYLSVLGFIRRCAAASGDVEKWWPVDLSSGDPPNNLACVREQLLGKIGPLEPLARDALKEERRANNYLLPDVDRLAFQSDLLSRGVELPILRIPDGIKAKLVVYALDERGDHSRVVYSRDTFHEAGELSFDRESVSGKLRLVAWVFPADPSAYEYFSKNGMKHVVSRRR